MSRETAFRYLANRKISGTFSHEIISCGFRLEALVENLKPCLEPKLECNADNDRAIENILSEVCDIAVAIRVYAEKLNQS